MKADLLIPIVCGEKTCASAPGMFCSFLRTAKFGVVFYCAIWHDEGPQPLAEKDGWVLRRPECLAAQQRARASTAFLDEALNSGDGVYRP